MGNTTSRRDGQIHAAPRSPKSSAATDSAATDGTKRSPYPPDLLPGARDVPSPYGTCRVYEWGLSDGPKILFIHGLSTPSPALGGVAHALATRGYRVMLLDLWGRGYSDTPRDLPHDSRLYAAQILLAASTSAVSWTGVDSGGFALAGYSVGGGIAAAFAAAFPQLVSALVLMAPGGLYESLPRGYRALPMRAPRLFPLAYRRRFVRNLLNAPAEYHLGKRRKDRDHGRKEPAAAFLEDGAATEDVSPMLDVRGIVDWEIAEHPGFVHSVTSAVRHAPIVRQHATWKRVGAYLDGTAQTQWVGGLPNRLWKGNLLLMLGEKDTVLPEAEFCRQAYDTIGADNVVLKTFRGGHVFPMVVPGEVAEEMYAFL